MRSKLIKRWLLVKFVKHRYWFNQGNTAFASMSVIQVEKLAVIMAAAKYLIGQDIPNWIVYAFFGVYCIWRFLSRWLVGWFWHHNNGYDIESEWNKGKMPPGRMEIINIDELSEAIVRKIKDGKILE
jgi:hypothetical protein